MESILAGPILRVEIKNDHPIALDDLAASLGALSDEYREWVQESSDVAVTDDLHLFVRELRSGSTIADLVALAPVALPFVENANTVIDFASYLKFAIGALLKRDNQTAELPQHSYKNLPSILEPIAKDSGSQLNVSTVVNGDVNIYLHVDHVEANAAQNAARRSLKESAQPVTGLHQQVAMSMHQARNDVKSSAGDRAIIESIYPKAVKVVFASEELKRQVLQRAENPFEGGYLIDVQVETINGRPAIYKVLTIHDTLDSLGDEAA